MIDGIGAVGQTVAADRLGYKVGHDPDDEVGIPGVADGRQVVRDREEPRGATATDLLRLQKLVLGKPERKVRSRNNLWHFKMCPYLEF